MGFRAGLGMMTEQDRQCTCNLTLWRVRVTIVAVETRQCILCLLLKLHVPVNCIKKKVFFLPHFVLPSVASLAVRCYIVNGTIVGKNY